MRSKIAQFWVSGAWFNGVKCATIFFFLPFLLVLYYYYYYFLSSLLFRSNQAFKRFRGCYISTFYYCIWRWVYRYDARFKELKCFGKEKINKFIACKRKAKKMNSRKSSSFCNDFFNIATMKVFFSNFQCLIFHDKYNY